MTLLSRAAALAAIALGIAGIIGASTPGFALELDKSINFPMAHSVPEPTAMPKGLVIPAEPAVATDGTTSDQDAEYASLSAAVAAQDTDTLDADLACMAGAIYFEAKGEPLSGQLAVAEVIMNRAKSGRFPTSICSVVTQRGQFSFVRHGRIPPVRSGRAYRTAIAVARVAMTDVWDSPASDAMYFHARRVSPGWRMTKVAAIGNHIFYR